MGLITSVTSGLGLEPGAHGLQKYSSGYCFIENTLLTEEASFTLEKNSNSTPKHTLAKGFAGVSLGSGTIEITIENAVPSKDFELKPDFFLRTNAVVEVGVVMGARTTRVKGYITNASYSHSVNDSSKLTFKLICRLADFE